MNHKILQILKNGGLFVLLLGLTFYIILKDNSLSQMPAQFLTWSCPIFFWELGQWQSSCPVKR